MAKSISKIAVSAICIIIAILTIALLGVNLSALKKSKPVSVLGYSFSYVPTESMEPTIMKKDVIVFRKVKYESLKVNDIIIYKSQYGETDGMLIVHRIIEITDEGLVMKGDNNPGIDVEVVNKDMFVGKYIRVVNGLSFNKLFSNKNIIFGLLVIILSGLAVLEVVNIIFTYQKEKLASVNAKSKQEVLDEMRKELLEEIKKEQKEKSTKK